ncbi:MAG TPA: GPW/gp25 family protein [Verrucomicrobiae bacterium]|nr:GPW/gp25 family protein [Verrucomicrobiae bacterium]
MNSDFQQNDFLGVGWSFPPTFTPGPQPLEMTQREEDIDRSLQILLTTLVGERVMQPKYGCNLEPYLFESLDTTTKTVIVDKVKTAILYFEPRIDAKRITLNTECEIEGIVLIEVEYVVRATNSRLNFVFPYYKNEGTELNLLTTNSGIAN